MTDNTIPVIENPEQASTNFYWTWDANGQIFNLQTTVRGVLTLTQVQAHVKTAMEAMAHIQELGGIAKQIGNNAYTAQVSSAATLPQPPANPNDIPGSEPQDAPAKESAANPLSFETELLTCEIRGSGNESKQYFKVKGGMFKKFGITVWPEVLSAAGIPVAKLEARDYKLHGYIAEYELNDKGKPHKITRLEKVA